MPSRRHLALLAVLLPVGLLGAACGDDDSSGDDPTIEVDDGGNEGAATDEGTSDDGGESSEGPNPCELITLAEMEAAFGFAWNEGGYAPPDIAPNATCTWSDADPGAPAKVVTLSVVTDAQTEEAFGQSVDELYDATKAAFTEADVLEADLGLGDDSYRTSGGIYILDGDTMYTLITIGDLSDEAVAGLKAMAEAVVG